MSRRSGARNFRRPARSASSTVGREVAAITAHHRIMKHETVRVTSSEGWGTSCNISPSLLHGRETMSTTRDLSETSDFYALESTPGDEDRELLAGVRAVTREA